MPACPQDWVPQQGPLQVFWVSWAPRGSGRGRGRCGVSLTKSLDKFRNMSRLTYDMRRGTFLRLLITYQSSTEEKLFFIMQDDCVVTQNHCTTRCTFL